MFWPMAQIESIDLKTLVLINAQGRRLSGFHFVTMANHQGVCGSQHLIAPSSLALHLLLITQRRWRAVDGCTVGIGYDHPSTLLSVQQFDMPGLAYFDQLIKGRQATARVRYFNLRRIGFFIGYGDKNRFRLKFICGWG